MVNDKIAVLYGLAEKVSRLAVNCSGCSACCYGGLVYVFDWEKSLLENAAVPLLIVDGVSFIRRVGDGCCPMLDRATGLCSIYAARPFCCRLFPLDLFSRNGRLEWGIYEYCPWEKRCVTRFVVANGSQLYGGQIADAVALIEKELDPVDIEYLHREDSVCASIELLDEHRNDFSIVSNLAQHLVGPTPRT